MRNHDGYDARDSYKHVEDAMGENFCNGNDDIKSCWQETTLLNFLTIFPNKIDQISSLINY